jgi:hypothetical protein
MKGGEKESEFSKENKEENYEEIIISIVGHTNIRNIMFCWRQLFDRS